MLTAVHPPLSSGRSAAEHGGYNPGTPKVPLIPKNSKNTPTQVSLEMDEESEDEVEALAEMYDPDGSAAGTHRFALLRELWASAR